MAASEENWLPCMTKAFTALDSSSRISTAAFAAAMEKVRGPVWLLAGWPEHAGWLGCRNWACSRPDAARSRLPYPQHRCGRVQVLPIFEKIGSVFLFARHEFAVKVETIVQVSSRFATLDDVVQAGKEVSLLGSGASESVALPAGNLDQRGRPHSADGRPRHALLFHWDALSCPALPRRTAPSPRRTAPPATCTACSTRSTSSRPSLRTWPRAWRSRWGMRPTGARRGLFVRLVLPAQQPEAQRRLQCVWQPSLQTPLLHPAPVCAGRGVGRLRPHACRHPRLGGAGRHQDWHDGAAHTRGLPGLHRGDWWAPGGRRAGGQGLLRLPAPAACPPQPACMPANLAS